MRTPTSTHWIMSADRCEHVPQALCQMPPRMQLWKHLSGFVERCSHLPWPSSKTIPTQTLQVCRWADPVQREHTEMEAGYQAVGRQDLPLPACGLERLNYSCGNQGKRPGLTLWAPLAIRETPLSIAIPQSREATPREHCHSAGARAEGKLDWAIW